jgi:hypothetical protein
MYFLLFQKLMPPDVLIRKNDICMTWNRINVSFQQSDNFAKIITNMCDLTSSKNNEIQCITWYSTQELHIFNCNIITCLHLSNRWKQKFENRQNRQMYMKNLQLGLSLFMDSYGNSSL